MAEKIVEACRNGDVERVKHFLEEQHVNPNECKDDQYGKTLLHWASHYGHLIVMKYLVENCKCDPMCRDVGWRNTPLHWAARFANLEAVKYLVEDCKCDVMCRNDHNTTPLHDAAIGGRLEVVAFLISKTNCDPEVPGQWGRTPLHYACERGDIAVVRILLESSEHVNPSCKDEAGLTPLHLAASHGSLSVVKYLIEEKCSEMECRNNHHETPLHESIKGGRLEVMKYLISKGCDPMCRGMFGGTALYYACQYGRVEEVKYLIADDNLAIDSPCDNIGATPLHIAAGNGRLDIVKLLVETFMCKLDVRDSNGETPLDYAQNGHEKEIVSYLREFDDKNSGSLRHTLMRQLRPNSKQVIPTGTVLGSGAYGSVIELRFEGKIVAGKIFRTTSAEHRIAVQERIKDELTIMMEVNHPNVVQTMGVCFLPYEPLPVLLMERMDYNLHSCLMDPKHFRLPIRTKLSILCDIANGLTCLHNHRPVIVHRDLTANNVLLNSQLKAKIADFGNSRIFDTHTMIPGVSGSLQEPLDYNPFEGHEEMSECSPSIDVFQFGHLALFTVIQTPVRPLLAQTYTDEKTRLCARSEVERRQPFVEKAEQLLSKTHSLVVLIKQCLHNNPAVRPSSRNLLTTLQKQLNPGYHLEPKFPTTELESRIREIRPVIIRDEIAKNAVQLFARQVVLILHTCNPSEYWAALERLNPPTADDGSEIQDRPIIYPSTTDDRSEIQDRPLIDSVIGCFAGYRAAVVKTAQGNEGSDVLTKSLTESFPNAQVILEAGMAYASDQKCKLADVLISKECTVVGGEITSRHPHQQIDPNVMRVFKDAAKDWSDKNSFTCANDHRTSVAHIGCVVSAPTLAMLREQLLHAPNSIGGEIEGWVLFELKKTLKVQNEKDIEIIIINGVSEYQDLTMGDKWQWTAAKAIMDCIHYCLKRSGGTEFNADNIARKEAREHHYEAYQQALKEGAAVPLKYLKMLFFGPPRTGKTSMRRRLVGEIKNLENEPVQPSTGTAECCDVIVKKDKITTETGVITKSKWSSVKVLFGKEKNTHVLDEELGLLYQLTYNFSQAKHSDAPIDNKPLDENRSPVPPNENRPSNENEPLNENKSPVRAKQQNPVRSQEKVSSNKTTDSNFNTSTQWVKPNGGREYELSAEDIERKEIDKEFEAFDKILRTSGEGQIKDLLEGTILMNMVDTGGQPAFLEMLPALTMGPALYLIFFRLNQELKETYKIHYVSKDNEGVPLGDSLYTVEEVIFQALSSIACFSCGSPNKPNMSIPSHAAVLMGTHKDLLSDPEAEIRKKDDALQENIEKNKIIVQSFSDHQLVFAIDNMKGDETELTNVRKRLQQVIEQMFHGDKLIPASWLMFGIFLRRMGKCIISLSQCQMIGERLEVKDTSEALWFLHHCVGILMHFPEVKEIKDVVICDPQIVFNSVTSLILNSFTSELVHDSSREKFKNKGLFSFSDIEDIQKLVVKTECENFPLPKLVKLLEYLNIISPIKAEGSIPQSDEMYFMPAILGHAKENELLVEQSPTDPIPRLMIPFKCGFVPVGVFCAMIASLVSQGWELYNDTDHTLCKNRATFRIFDGTYDITLTSMPKWFEIHIARIANPHKALQEICQQVLIKVCNTLDEVIFKMNYGQVIEISYELGFKCPIHPNDDHLAINKPRDEVKASSQSSMSLWLNYCKEESVMKCHKECKKVDLGDQNLVWFGKAIPVNIIRHPEDKSVTTGAHINFHVEATGYDVLHFQWQKDEKCIDINDPRFSSEETNGASTLHIQRVKKSDEGYYNCLMKNAFEESGKPSREAKLTVCDPTQNTETLQSVTTRANRALTFHLKLDEKNVVDVLHEARFADGDWENLGQQLMIEHHVLKTIKVNHPGQSSLCMSCTISQWLNNDLEASWEKLAEAVIKVEGYGEANAHTVQQKAGICAPVTSEEKRVSSQSQPISTADTHRRKHKLSEDEDVGAPKKAKLEESVRSPQERKRKRTESEPNNEAPTPKKNPTAAEQNPAEEPGGEDSLPSRRTVPDSDQPSEQQLERMANTLAVHDIAEFLRKIKLEHYVQLFTDNDVDGGLLLKLTDNDLKDLGVDNGFHRRKIISKFRAHILELINK